MSEEKLEKQRENNKYIRNKKQATNGKYPNIALVR